MPLNASFDKGAVVEEWSDAHFFRPVGLRIARIAFPTRVTPDQITLLALVFGLVAGHLFYYRSVPLNALGVVLFVVSDFFDSADGQLARMRGTSTRFGRMLDGLSDTTRFANLYLTLIARQLATGSSWWGAIALGAAAGFLHSLQSGAVDYIKQLYLHVARRGDGELDLPEDVADTSSAANMVRRFQMATYAGYVARQARLFPHSLAIVRAMRSGADRDQIADQWAIAERAPVRQCAWVAQNIRFLLLALTVVPGFTSWYLWITIVPMTLFTVGLVAEHERRAGQLLQRRTPAIAAAA